MGQFGMQSNFFILYQDIFGIKCVVKHFFILDLKLVLTFLLYI